MIHHSTIVFVDFYQIKGRLLIFPFFSILRLCLIVVDIISQRRFLVAASCVDLGFSRYCYINQDTVRASPCHLVSEFWKRLTLMTVTRNRRSTKPSGSAPSSTLWRISFPSRANWKRLYSSKIWRPSSPVGAARRFPTSPPPFPKKKRNRLGFVPGDRSFSLWTSGSAERGAASDWFWNNTTPEPFQYTNWCAFQPLNGSWSPYRAIFTRTGCWNNGYDAESYRVLCETDFYPSVPGKKNKAALPAMDRHFVEFEGLSMCRHSLFTWWNSCVHPLFPYKIETGFDRLI